MSNISSIIKILSISLLAGCTTQKFIIDEVGYSSWKGETMNIRKKAILLNTETGETWSLTYKKSNPTNDGYAWEKLPKETQNQ